MTSRQDSSLYVVVCDKRDNSGSILFMVDRKKQTKSFWSDRLDDVFVYSLKGAAERKAASLSYNNPRVMTLRDAKVLATLNPSVLRREARQDFLFHEAAMADIEAGWDGHKACF